MKYKRIITILSCLFFIALTAFAARPKRALELQISGVENSIKENIDRNLSNAKNELPRPLTKSTVTKLYLRTNRLIKEAIAPYGYFHPRITRNLIKTEKGWEIKLDIQKGVPNKISSINVNILGTGKTHHRFKHLLTNLPLKAGDILETKKYESIKTSLLDIASELGYFKAKLTKNVIYINNKTHQSRIVISLKTGKRYRFGKTIFSKSNFHSEFLKEFLFYHYGNYYDAREVEKTQEMLLESNHFSQVLVSPDVAHIKNGHVPIQISLTPRQDQVYSVGLGYGTDTLFRATLGITVRNIGDWGQRFKTLLRISQNNSSFVSNYIIPGSNPVRDLYTLTAGYTNLNLDDGSFGKSTIFGATYTRKMNKWSASFSLNYLNELYSIKNLPQVNTQLVYPSMEISYLNSDHKMNPTKGINFSTLISGTKQSFLSKIGFTQIKTTLKTLYTIKHTHTRLLFRNMFGYTNIKNLNSLPLSLQLQTGGAKTVRGYSYNVIGPGRNLIVASGEIQQRVYGQFYAAAFADAAVVGDNQNLFSKIYMGVGPGLVYLTPVGAIELTIANAINEPNKPWIIQFTMGSVLS